VWESHGQPLHAQRMFVGELENAAHNPLTGGWLCEASTWFSGARL
jgi:hypothetical protein